ncbi:MAG: PIN domain-containing protein [Thermoplasmatota archaeon]
MMKAVADANVVAAALIRPGGWSAEQFARSDVEWIVPTFLAEELRKHKAEFAEKARCDKAEWDRRLNRMMARVRVIGAADLIEAASDERVVKIESADPDDAPYVAAYVAAQADWIWTRDKVLLEELPGIAVTVVPAPGPP